MNVTCFIPGGLSCSPPHVTISPLLFRLGNFYWSVFRLSRLFLCPLAFVFVFIGYSYFLSESPYFYCSIHDHNCSLRHLLWWTALKSSAYANTNVIPADDTFHTSWHGPWYDRWFLKIFSLKQNYISLPFLPPAPPSHPPSDFPPTFKLTFLFIIVRKQTYVCVLKCI